MTFHPSETTLLSYAAGSACSALSLTVACHLAFCHGCRSAMGTAEAMGGSLLDDLPPAGMSLLSRMSVLARLGTRDEPAPRPRRVVGSDIPAPLARYMVGPEAQRFADLPWRTIAPGTYGIDLSSGRVSDGTIRLMRFDAGFLVPHHDHRESDTTLELVLKGAFVDQTGRVGLGDVEEIGTDFEHSPVVTRSESCICLIATGEAVAA